MKVQLCRRKVLGDQRMSSTFKVGLGIGILIWAVFAVLAIAGPLSNNVTVMFVGVVFGVLSIPFAIWVARQDAADH